MTLVLLFKAILLGMINAAPIGPVGLLCLKKNLSHDRLEGLSAALGMALAYAIVAFCVLIGMKWIGQFLEDYRVVLQITAGLALGVMGWRGLRSHAVKPRKRKCVSGYLGDFSASFAMTLFNPVPFATFAVILATFKVVGGNLDLVSDIHFGLCVAGGTMIFWLIVNQVLHMVKKRSPESLSHRIAQGSAWALIVVGSAIFLAAFV